MAGGGNAWREFRRLGEVFAIQHVKTSQLLLCLGKRAIRGQYLAVPHPHRRRSVRGHESFTGQQYPSFPYFFWIVAVVHLCDLLFLLRRLCSFSVGLVVQSQAMTCLPRVPV